MANSNGKCGIGRLLTTLVSLNVLLYSGWTRVAVAVKPVASSHTNIFSDCDKNADTHTLWRMNERKKKSFSRTQRGMGFGSV